MTNSRVTELLNALADSTGEPVPVASAVIVQRARARRLRRRGLLAAVGVAAIASVVVWPRADHRSVGVVTSPSTVVASMTAGQLATGQWSELPPAPLADRTGEVVAWAGSEMIVWGGTTSSGTQAFADGAGYDPTTNAWHAIASSPLSARVGASATWTGSELIVWGGFDQAVSPNHTADDGAAYSPATDSWRALPRAPLAARGYSSAVWTGSEVIIVGGQDDSSQTYFVDAAAYDPSTNSWRLLPPFAKSHGFDAIAAVWAGDRLVVADERSTATVVDPSTTSFDDGIDFSIFNPATNEWMALPPSTGAPAGINGLFWTGSEVVAPTAQSWCGLHSCPPSFFPQGARLDLASSHWTNMSPGPVDDGNGSSAWTGAALLHLASAQIGDSARPINPGDAALWDPVTDTWTSLTPAPLQLSPTSPGIWTGREVLFWGDLYDTPPNTHGHSSGGLRFGPAAGSPTTTASQSLSS